MDKTERLDLLKDLIKFDTVGGNEDEIAHYIVQLFKDHGISSSLLEVEPGRYDVLAEIGNGQGKTIALTGHQDVVDFADITKWETKPLDPVEKDGKLFGRGTTDMKGGLAAEIIALIELKESGAEIPGKAKFFATVGEESSSQNHMQGAQKIAKDGLMDGINALIVGEPTSIPVEWLSSVTAQNNPYHLSQETLRDLKENNHAHQQSIVCYAHKGSITYQIDVIGKAAHSSAPELGINAIDELMEFDEKMKRIFTHLTAVNDPLGKTVAVDTKITGGDQLNSVPATASLFVKVRTIPEVSNQSILEELNTLVESFNELSPAKFSIKILGNKWPVYTDPSAKLFNVITKVGEKTLSQKLPFAGMTGGTDAAELTKDHHEVEVAVFGPGNFSAHQENEYVDIDTYLRFIDTYKEIISNYLTE